MAFFLTFANGRYVPTTPFRTKLGSTLFWSFLCSVLVIDSCLAADSPTKQSSVGILLVSAAVNNTTVRFVVDTGAERSIIDASVADQLGLVRAGTVTIQQPYKVGHSELVRIADFTFGSVHFHQCEMAVIDLAPFSKALGESINGILGADILSHLIVSLNYSSGTVNMKASGGGLGHPIRLVRRNNRYFVPFKVQGQPFNLLLDTGSNFSSLSWNAWESISKHWVPKSLIEGATFVGGWTGLFVCFPTMAIDSITLSDQPLNVQSPAQEGSFADPAFDGLLGGEILQQFQVTLDLAQDTIYLLRDPMYKRDLYRFSTIGIQFLKEESGAFTITSVWKSSPAERAGLRPKDQIVQVNDRNTKSMSIDNFVRKIHGEVGTEVRLSILSQGEQRSTTIRIERLLCGPEEQ